LFKSRKPVSGESLYGIQAISWDSDKVVCKYAPIVTFWSLGEVYLARLGVFVFMNALGTDDQAA